jgi:hypothetical protein
MLVIHTQYGLEPPFPPFNPMFALGIPKTLLFNSGDCLYSLSWTNGVDSRPADKALAADDALISSAAVPTRTRYLFSPLRY